MAASKRMAEPGGEAIDYARLGDYLKALAVPNRLELLPKLLPGLIDHRQATV